MDEDYTVIFVLERASRKRDRIRVRFSIKQEADAFARAALLASNAEYVQRLWLMEEGPAADALELAS